jgi:hypothetical protein
MQDRFRSEAKVVGSESSMRGAVLAFLVLVGAVFQARGGDHSLTAVWRVGSTWAVTVCGTDRQIVGTMTVRVTAERAKSCMAGDWKRLEVIRRQFNEEVSWQRSRWPTRSTIRTPSRLA